MVCLKECFDIAKFVIRKNIETIRVKHTKADVKQRVHRATLLSQYPSYDLYKVLKMLNFPASTPFKTHLKYITKIAKQISKIPHSEIDHQKWSKYKHYPYVVHRPSVVEKICPSEAARKKKSQL